jgi:hypothetical protein
MTQAEVRAGESRGGSKGKKKKGGGGGGGECSMEKRERSWG